MKEFEYIELYNVNNGERFATYIIKAPRGTGTISLNGAAARRAGAHGVYLSGGGSTIAAFVTDHEESVAGAMLEAAAAHGLQAETRIVGLSSRGTEVVA